jgi:hypothetical protein
MQKSIKQFHSLTMVMSLELGLTDAISMSLVSINVWRLAGDTLTITCNFLYCNHQVHRDFLITLYKGDNQSYRPNAEDAVPTRLLEAVDT